MPEDSKEKQSESVQISQAQYELLRLKASFYDLLRQREHADAAIAQTNQEIARLENLKK